MHVAVAILDRDATGLQRGGGRFTRDRNGGFLALARGIAARLQHRLVLLGNLSGDLLGRRRGCLRLTGGCGCFLGHLKSPGWVWPEKPEQRSEYRSKSYVAPQYN